MLAFQSLMAVHELPNRAGQVFTAESDDYTTEDCGTMRSDLRVCIVAYSCTHMMTDSVHTPGGSIYTSKTYI